MSKKYWVVIILSSILLFHFFNNFIWLKKDNFVTGMDGGWHLIEAVKYHVASKRILHSQAPFFTKAVQLIQIFRFWRATTENWPPLVYFLSALIGSHEIHIFGPRLYVNFIFYIILVLSTYFLGKKCFNRRVGLMAAFLVSFYPAVSAYSRQFGLDFPLLCVTAACVCLLVYSENFSKGGYSLLFGLSLGMGTLVKLQILFFLWMPLLCATLGTFRQKNSEKLNGFSNLILSCAIAFCLFYFYWGKKIGIALTSFYDHAFMLYPFYAPRISLVSGAPIPILSLKSITFYLESLLFHASFFPFILFTGALVVFLFSKSKWRTFFLLSFLSAYLIISLLSVKWTRYALPLLPFMAIISGWLIDSIRSRYIKILILCALVFYTINFYFCNSWTLKKYPLAPQPFLPLAAPDRGFSNLYPPDSFDYTEELKEAGIIPYIEQEIREGKVIKMEFGGERIEDPMVFLYLYFQDAILNGTITMQRDEASDFQDANCVFIRNPDFLTIKGLSKSYRILSRIKESVFLIKNEKNLGNKIQDEGGPNTNQSKPGGTYSGPGKLDHKIA